MAGKRAEPAGRTSAAGVGARGPAQSRPQVAERLLSRGTSLAEPPQVWAALSAALQQHGREQDPQSEVFWRWASGGQRPCSCVRV